MARILDPKCKQCRRAGMRLFLKGERCFTAKCPMVKRAYPPGVHGPKGALRLSEYGLQLREKQKAKKVYGVQEKRFKGYYLLASKKKEDTSQILLQLLESRLDNAVYRLGLAKSRALARQLVSHGHFLVNDRKADIPSYQLKPKDTIKVKESSKKNKYFQNIAKVLKGIRVPKWLKLDAKNLEAEIVDLPSAEDMEKIIDMSLIVEYYSR